VTSNGANTSLYWEKSKYLLTHPESGEAWARSSNNTARWRPMMMIDDDKDYFSSLTESAGVW
jgi:hypothetical protein